MADRQAIGVPVADTGKKEIMNLKLLKWLVGEEVLQPSL
jgi:hypothetical protein